ncbi:MAG: hypothetical protein O7G87_24265 [bacterium]|nr:hypothetical protein [bacterium]
MDRYQPPGLKTLAAALSFLLLFVSCTQNVILRAPFPEKLRIGDGVKIVTQDGTTHSGRIVYLDRAVVVIRTPTQISKKSPVKTEKFGTTILWKDVVQVKAAGTLDSQRKFISSEEIRVNARTRHKRNYLMNVGLLGLGLSFLTATWVQDRISPSNTDLSVHRPTLAQFAFWTTLAGGTAGMALLGYGGGAFLDRRLAMERIERRRAKNRQTQAQVDSLLTKTREQINQTRRK